MTHFDVRSLQLEMERRNRIFPILDAALDAVDPFQAVCKAIHWDEDGFQIRERFYRWDDYQRVFLLAFGKAATPMAQAVAHGLGPRLEQGLVITKYGHGPSDPTTLEHIEIIEAGHPIPDAMGVAAAQRAANMLRALTAQDLLITLISGGGSALLTLPAANISLNDLQQTTDLLLACGANIHEINTIRKHLSQVKGGQLARLAHPASTISLILSDVIGNPLDVIASGPTVPDPTTWEDAWKIVKKYHLTDQLPDSVSQHLKAGLAGLLPDTPKPDDPIFEKVQTHIVGDNALAAEAALQTAISQGFHAMILTTFLQGEAKEVAQMLVSLGREVVAHNRPLAQPACLILGGETTVTLRGKGKGGRNQEIALAAAIPLAQIPEGDKLVILSLATDGTDGPTDAAGGIADGTTVKRGLALGLDAESYLANNDSYHYLQAIGHALFTGPTRTNVNDLMFIFIFE